jgi:hypothetical protein
MSFACSLTVLICQNVFLQLEMGWSFGGSFTYLCSFPLSFFSKRRLEWSLSIFSFIYFFIRWLASPAWRGRRFPSLLSLSTYMYIPDCCTALVHVGG